MLETRRDAGERRRLLREGLASGALLRFPGAFNALSALAIERAGFEGIYVSGAVVSATLGLPDIGLTTASEVAERTAEVARVSALPTLVDADTGFGEPMNVARAVQLLEDAGASGCHLEDQVMPKRCGHLEGKQLVGREEMLRRIAAGVAGRRDADFVICARTDARATEGLEATIERAKAYVDAGADMIFPEALADESEFAALRRAIAVPILANLTEFGKTPLIDASRLADLGVNLVIYPVTLLRLAMGAVVAGLRHLHDVGNQSELVASMQTRAELYDLIDYAGYGRLDESLVSFADVGVLATGATNTKSTTGEERGDG